MPDMKHCSRRSRLLNESVGARSVAGEKIFLLIFHCKQKNRRTLCELRWLFRSGQWFGLGHVLPESLRDGHDRAIDWAARVTCCAGRLHALVDGATQFLKAYIASQA